MLKYCIAALCVLAVAEAGVIKSSYAISTVKVSPFGIVEGITSCGSAGQILQVRVTDCTKVPCQTQVGKTYLIEIDFKPSTSHSSLNLKVLLIHQGAIHLIVDTPVEGSEVEAGNTYTFNYEMPISGNFMGLSDLRIEISGGAIVELCGVAGLNVVPAPGQIAFVPSSSAVSAAKVAPFGIVEGITSCGSAGQILQVRVTDCTKVPCQAQVGRVYLIEIDFKPSSSHSSLNLKVLLIHQGTTHPIVDTPVEGSEVEAGNTYTFNYEMPISGNYMGLSDLRIEISGGAIVELCGVAGLNVVPAPGF